MDKAGRVVSYLLLCFVFALFLTLFLSRESSDLSFLDDRIISLLKFTIFQAFLSTFFSIFIGVLLAWSLAHRSKFFGREMLVALFSSSLVLPTLVVVFGLISIYGRNGWINTLAHSTWGDGFDSYLYGLFGIVLAHVYLNASYASRSLLHAFESIPIERYKLSKSLGFNSLKQFFYVEFSAIKSTIIGISSIIFLLCFTSFAVVLILGGSPSYNTLEVAIYEAVRLDFDIDLALKLSFLQLSISTVLVILSSSLTSKVSNLTQKSTIFWSEGAYIKFFQWFFIIVFALFFITPLFSIVIDGYKADFSKIFSDKVFIKSFITSITLALISAVLTLVFSILLSDAKRRAKSKFSQTLIGVSSNLYLAIPSLVLGLGFFLLSLRFPLSENTWSIIALLFANVLMALPFSISIISPLMIKTAKRYDRLSSSLGLSGYSRWKNVEFPYLRSSLAYVFSLAFCFSLGDLGIIALFGNDGFTTLPWYLYSLMGSYRTIDASGVALILLVLVLSVFLLIPRVFKEKSS